MPQINPWAAMPLNGQPVQAGDDLVGYLAAQRPELFASPQPTAPPAAAMSVPRGTSETQVSETRTKTSGPAPGGGLSEAISRLNAKELESLKNQGLTIEALQKQLTGLQDTSTVPMDLTGLAALTDAWSGSNFAGAYKPAETLKDRKAAIEKLQGAVLNAQQGMSENEIALLRSQLNNQLQVDNLSYRREQDSVQNDFERQKIAIASQAAANKGSITPEDGFNLRVKMTNLEPAKQARGITGFLAALNEYEQAVDKFGVSPTGEGASVLNSAYAKMSTRFKEAENLGALSGPDMKILNQNVANAGGFDAWFSGQVKGGKTGVKAALTQTRKGADNDFQHAYKNLKGVARGVEPAVQPVLDDYQSAYNEATGAAKTAAKSREEKIAELKRLREGK